MNTPKIIMHVLVFLLCVSDVYATDTGKNINKINEAIEVLTDITKIPEKEIPPSLLKNSYGIAIIPNVLKAGFVIGGRYGTGIMAVRDSTGMWQNPFYISLMGGSLGWQIGVQSADIVLVFKSKKSVAKMRNGKFTLGADAAVAAGPVGRQAQLGTDIKLSAEIYSYAKSRGLFAGVALEGAALQVDKVATEEVYGASLYEVDKGKGTLPAEMSRLKQLIDRYTTVQKEEGR